MNRKIQLYTFYILQVFLFYQTKINLIASLTHSKTLCIQTWHKLSKTHQNSGLVLSFHSHLWVGHDESCIHWVTSTQRLHPLLMSDSLHLFANTD